MNENYMPVGEVAPFDAYSVPTPGYGNEMITTVRLEIFVKIFIEKSSSPKRTTPARFDHNANELRAPSPI